MKLVAIIFILSAVCQAQNGENTLTSRSFASSDGPTFDSDSQSSPFGSVSTVASVNGGSAKPTQPAPIEPVPVQASAPAPTAVLSEVASSPVPIEDQLRGKILDADVEGAAKVLESKRVIGLAAGLTYPEELEIFVKKSSDRNNDPDVVAFKALALSALNTYEAGKLALVSVLSLQPDCMCAAVDSETGDDLVYQLTEEFSDIEALQEVVEADANTELVPEGRKLKVAEASPVNSFFCTYCWPRKQCKLVHWC